MGTRSRGLRASLWYLNQNVLMGAFDSHLRFCVYEDAFTLWDIGLRKDWDDSADRSLSACASHLMLDVPTLLLLSLRNFQ